MMVRNESSSRRPQAVVAFGVVVAFAIGLFVLTCSDKVTQPKQPITPKITDISELQQQYGELLVNLIAELDSSTAKDSVVKLILTNQELVETALASSQGIAIKYRDGQRGGIMIDPEDMAGSIPDAAARFYKQQVPLDTVEIPKSHSSIFLCPIYTERRAYADQIIQSANENLPRTGFEPFEVFADDSCGIGRFKNVDNCGILHIYSHSFAWPRKDSIEDVYLMTGDTLTVGLKSKYATDMAAGKVASIYVPGRGNMLFIDHRFFTQHNNFAGNLSIVYLGFGYGFASKWYQQIRYLSNAGVCIGHDWRVYADKNANWASEFYGIMCDTSRTRQMTLADWYDGIVTSYTDTLETTPPLPHTTEIRFHGMSEISMWRSLKILSVTPASAPPGAKVYIRGFGFGGSRNLGRLTICGIEPEIQSWADTLIVAYVPQDVSRGDIQVTVGTISSNTIPFWVVSIDNIYPSRVVYGDTITVTGRGFGEEREDGDIVVGGKIAPVLSWSNTEIRSIVPDGAEVGIVFLSKYGVASAGAELSIFGITRVIPSRVSRGDTVDIYTSGFVCRYYSWGVYFDSIKATQTYGWLNDHIRVLVPTNVSSVCTLTVTCEQLRCKGYPLYVTGVTEISSNWGGPGSDVRIYGSGFGNEPASVIFAPESEASVSLWTDDSVIAVVPESALSGAISVVYDGASFQSPIYNVMHIDRLEPTFGLPGLTVVIRGVHFLDYRITDSVTFDDHSANLVYWSDTMATVTVPAIGQSEDVTLHVKGARSNRVRFSLLGADRIEPIWGPVGTELSIIGKGFATTPVSVFLTGQTAAVSHSVISDTLITLFVPSWAKSGPVQMRFEQMLVAESYFDVFRIDSLAPLFGVAGDVVKIYGSGFGGQSASDSVFFGSKPAKVTYWRNTLVCALVPEDATTCELKMVKNGVQASAGTFTVYRKPVVQSITPQRGTYGTQVSIRGLYFGETRGSGGVKFGGVTAQISTWSDTLIAALYPSGCKTDSLRVTAGGFTSDPVPYAVHGIVKVTPTQVAAGSLMTITGTGFGEASASSYVRIGDVTLPHTIWSDTLITAVVPEMAVSGSLSVTVDGLASNAVGITIVRRPVLTSINPSFGTYGMETTLSGQYFGASQGSSKVYFGSKSATIVSWSDHTIVAIFPDGSISDTVAVVVNGFGSNSLSYRVLGITALSKYWADVGDTLTVFGHGFGPSQSASHVEMGGQVISPLAWSDDSIALIIPPDAETGDVEVVVGGLTSNAKQLSIGVPANLLELLHQTNVVTIKFSGHLLAIHCSSTDWYQPPTCDTAAGRFAVQAVNSTEHPIIWDAGTFEMSYDSNFWFGGYSYQYYIHASGQVSVRGDRLLQASGGGSEHTIDQMAFSSWGNGHSVSARDFALQEVDFALVRISYKMLGQFGEMSQGCASQYRSQESGMAIHYTDRINMFCTDSLNAIYPREITVTFEKK